MTEQLPRADEAQVPEEKLRGYVLNPDHADGTHKARVFRSVFGITEDDWEALSEIFVFGVQGAAVDDVRQREDCSVYGVPITMSDLEGRERKVVTSWKVPHEGGPPTFVTAYLDMRRERRKLDG
jgi:hypothetical protein